MVNIKIDQVWWQRTSQYPVTYGIALCSKLSDTKAFFPASDWNKSPSKCTMKSVNSESMKCEFLELSS